jgi:hypothetical protein
MKKPSGKKQLSAKALEELRNQFFRVETLASAERMWERLFTAADRNKLGGELLPALKKYGTAGMFAKARRTSLDRAVLDIAVGIGHMSQANYEWLLREMGMWPATPKQRASCPKRPVVPDWNKAKGELRFGGQLIRKIRVLAKPTNIQLIVDVFQEEGWPSSIDNPLSGGADQHRLHLTLQSLNQGVKRIRFHGHKGGNAIYWEKR